MTSIALSSAYPIVAGYANLPFLRNQKSSVTTAAGSEDRTNIKKRGRKENGKKEDIYGWSG
jgi:hypothetical protein